MGSGRQRGRRELRAGAGGAQQVSERWTEASVVVQIESLFCLSSVNVNKDHVVIFQLGSSSDLPPLPPDGLQFSIGA